jgi:hypothetical protein
MKTKFLTIFAVLGLIAAVAGCYRKETGGHRFGMPIGKDKVTGAYERPLDEVYGAAKQVVTFNGTMVNESIDHSQTNLVKTIEGRVQQRRVYIRVEQLDPKLTQIIVQARGSAGGTDVDLAHELEKQIALKLVK